MSVRRKLFQQFAHCKSSIYATCCYLLFASLQSKTCDYECTYRSPVQTSAVFLDHFLSIALFLDTSCSMLLYTSPILKQSAILNQYSIIDNTNFFKSTANSPKYFLNEFIYVVLLVMRVLLHFPFSTISILSIFHIHTLTQIQKKKYCVTFLTLEFESTVSNESMYFIYFLKLQKPCHSKLKTCLLYV